ncbi:MAG TPA: Flp pilus assembly protein CpaB [Bryobacteraceae bacterium]|nr:Flp pilus assembly protein CpaB [Bryobacteraceae bacterium]
MDRQRAFLIFGVALASATLLSWFLYANTVAPRTERQVKIVVAAHDVPLGVMLKPADLKTTSYPESGVPKGAVLQTKDALYHVLLVSMNTNEPVLLSKLSTVTGAEGMSATIEPGYRAVSVAITDVNGVSGLIQPNSRVDVLFTRTGTIAEASTSTILQNVKVLYTGHAIAAGQTADPRAPRSQVATLLLTPADAQKLELAKNQGKIGLSLRNPLDKTEAENSGPMTAEVLDPTLQDRIARARRKGTEKDLSDPKAWEDLARRAAPKKEEKPAAIVDVYHGDKHVQEAFK